MKHLSNLSNPLKTNVRSEQVNQPEAYDPSAVMQRNNIVRLALGDLARVVPLPVTENSAEQYAGEYAPVVTTDFKAAAEARDAAARLAMQGHNSDDPEAA